VVKILFYIGKLKKRQVTGWIFLSDMTPHNKVGYKYCTKYGFDSRHRRRCWAGLARSSIDIPALISSPSSCLKCTQGEE